MINNVPPEYIDKNDERRDTLYYSSPQVRVNNREVSSYLKVVGEGVISVKPDQAAISLGVITERKSLQNAQQTNAKMTSQVLSALRNLQIPNENIQTTTFRINMQYDYKDGDQIFRGYRVTNIVRVTVNDINQVGLVVDTAVENGANTVNDIELMVSDSAPYQQQALSKAIQNAQVKANTVRQTTGLSIQTIPYKVKEIRFQETDRPKTMVLGVATESPATPVEPGIIDIRSVVEAKFLIT